MKHAHTYAHLNTHMHVYTYLVLASVVEGSGICRCLLQADGIALVTVALRRYVNASVNTSINDCAK